MGFVYAAWIGTLVVAGTSGCAGTLQSDGTLDRRDVTVMCNSAVGYDTAACQVRANDACGAAARLVGVISSVEMTGRRSGKLYTITARYACFDA